MKNFTRKYFGIILAFFAFCIKCLGSIFPEQLELIFSNNIYVVIRWVIDHSIGSISFNFVYFLFLIIAFVALLQIIKVIKGQIQLKILAINVLNFSGIIYTIFLFSWGLNYQRPNIKTKLQLGNVQENESVYLAEYKWVLNKAIQKRKGIIGVDGAAIGFSLLDSAYTLQIKTSVQNTLLAIGYKMIANPPVRKIGLNGAMRRLNIAGMYMPFTGEVLVDGSELPIKIIFTTAHELAHAYGIANEGEANFIAFLSCISSNEALIQYAGYYNYWRYVNSKLLGFHPDLYETYNSLLPEGIRADRDAIFANSKLYPAIFPEASDFINDSYLKSQGVENGVDSYDDFTWLVMSYKMKMNREIKNANRQ